MFACNDHMGVLLQLVAKNVAMEIATNLCDSVNKSLVGQKAGTFTRSVELVQKISLAWHNRAEIPRVSFTRAHDLRQHQDAGVSSFARCVVAHSHAQKIYRHCPIGLSDTTLTDTHHPAFVVHAPTAY